MGRHRLAGPDDPALSTSLTTADAGPSDVDVCVCTYRRPSLADTLRAIGRQTLDGRSIRVVVADNDGSPSARDLAAETCRAVGLRLLYVHAPERNISIARNACLDAVTAPLTAFVDDDETPGPAWLSQLMAHQRETGADVVLGRVVAAYPDTAPRWMRSLDLHSTRAVKRADGTIDTGYTANVLFRSDVLQGRRFEPALGRSGGEDTLFFHGLHAAGARIEEAPGARVCEVVTPPRARLEWLITRAFRSGQTHALMLRSRGVGKARILVLALAKVAWCVAATLGQAALLRAAWRRSAVRGALHLGVIARILGRKELELY